MIELYSNIEEVIDNLEEIKDISVCNSISLGATLSILKIDSFDVDFSIIRRIFSRILVMSNMIASQGRIGSGNFCLMHSKSISLINLSSEINILPNGNMDIAGIEIISNDDMDDIILVGRLNSIERIKIHTSFKLPILADPTKQFFGFKVVDMSKIRNEKIDYILS